MTSERCPEGINFEDQRILRLFKITKSVFPQALYLVFKWGCKKDPDESLEDYLTIKKNMENKHYRGKFDKSMRETIKKDPSGKKYDVSLLWACIRWGCDDLNDDQEAWREGGDGLESLCTNVKNYRNRLFHEDKRMRGDADMNEWCTAVMEVLEKLLDSAGLKYSTPDYETKEGIKDIKEQINKIMNAPLENPKKLHEEMLRLRAEQMNIINEQGKKELSELYKDISKIDPASFVTKQERLHVDNVFTKLEVICENKCENWDDNYDVQYNEILKMKTMEAKEPTIIVVEGDAGSGKTTLTKLILSDWAEGKSVFKGLEDYDLVLRGEGKNKHISSYLELIQVLMPTASYKLADDDLVRSVLQHKVLMVVDGFDELNAESEKLLRELSEKQIPRSSGKLQLLITTRPSKLTELLNIVKPHSVIQTKLKGISVDKRVEFVSKLHNEMKHENQNTQELIDLLKQSQARLGEHYRLPLNLTLLTYLWASDPNKVNPETTATGLYIAFLDLLQSRLLVRLQDHAGAVTLPKDKGEEVIREFLQELYRVCLDTLSSGFMQLSDLSTKALKEKCKNLKLPFNEMTEAFLTVEKEWTSSGYKTYLAVPHKSIMEFHAANGLMTHINKMVDGSSRKADVMSLVEKWNIPDEEREEKLQKILSILDAGASPEDAKSLREICEKHLNADLTVYENMFLHLTGLLAHQSPSRLQEYAQELVEILRNAGFVEKKQTLIMGPKRFRFPGTKLLDVLVEAKCDDKLAGLLAPFYSDILAIGDGHTGAALAMFKHLKTNIPVKIILENEVSYIPQLDDMFLQLSKRDCDVDISLKHQWKLPEYGFSDDSLNYLLNGEDAHHRCKVIRFLGHLKTLSRLPKSLKRLRITFTNTEHAQQLLKELTVLVETNDIKCFGIHVMPDVHADGLSPLPVVNTKKMECGKLWLSKVAGDWKDKCGVIRALQPVNGVFSSIIFSESNFSVNQCADIITELGKLEVKVKTLRFFSSILKKDQVIHLKELAKNTLGCPLSCLDVSIEW